MATFWNRSLILQVRKKPDILKHFLCNKSDQILMVAFILYMSEIIAFLNLTATIWVRIFNRHRSFSRNCPLGFHYWIHTFTVWPLCPVLSSLFYSKIQFSFLSLTLLSLPVAQSHWVWTCQWEKILGVLKFQLDR